MALKITKYAHLLFFFFFILEYSLKAIQRYIWFQEIGLCCSALVNRMMCWVFCLTYTHMPHMNGDECCECLRFPSWLCYMSKWLIRILGRCLLSAAAYSEATQLVPIFIPPPRLDPAACVGMAAYRCSNSLLPPMLRLFLAFSNALFLVTAASLGHWSGLDEAKLNGSLTLRITLSIKWPTTVPFSLFALRRPSPGDVIQGFCFTCKGACLLHSGLMVVLNPESGVY